MRTLIALGAAVILWVLVIAIYYVALRSPWVGAVLFVILDVAVVAVWAVRRRDV